jgi:hypothetical protein
MAVPLRLAKVHPTVYLQGPEACLRQLVRLSVENPGAAAEVTVEVRGPWGEEAVALGLVPGGASEHSVTLPLVAQPTLLRFGIHTPEGPGEGLEVAWRPPRRWVVHVVQRSHHDVGYTDIASTVLRQHTAFLDSVIDMVTATRTFPEEAQFRLVVEQAWSVDHFLRSATPTRAAKMIALMRSGHVELTALFGNMVTEVCGAEGLCRSLYHAWRLRREYGLPITTAEHNDVPGMSWGLSQVLASAGIRYFCPQLPRYWNWGPEGMQSFWDDDALLPARVAGGRPGPPGAFWWETPGGDRVLLWENAGVGGDVNPKLPGLADRLLELEERGFPYEVIRWPVGGGARDNAPYIDGYPYTAKWWNSRWAYPRLVCSTNAGFFEDFARVLPSDLPVFRGDLPGQDYPAGSTSTAAATGVNRRNHRSLPTAERLACMAASAVGHAYPKRGLFDAYEETLWYDEHTWGHHFPCGPTMRVSRAEKEVHAFRAEALAYDVASKSMARIADRVRVDGPGFHLVVFNPLAHDRTDLMSAPMREMDNCGSTMVEEPAGDDPDAGSYLRGVLLHDRWHDNPPAELVRGEFDLVDLASGETIPYQMVTLETPEEAVPDAPERYGIGHGGSRYGFFEQPSGLRRDLRFLAREVPACGYKTYRLAPRAAAPSHASRLRAQDGVLENEFYRLRVDEETGRIVSIEDLEAGRDLLDPASPHGFGAVVVRGAGEGEEWVLEGARVTPGLAGPTSVSLNLWGGLLGHPRIHQTVTLHAGLKRVDFAVRVLRDETPLLETHVAFPFALSPARFRYEGVLCHLSPVTDYLPGAYWDQVAVEGWVAASDDEMSILWSSLDAPIASLGALWPGYVSPAHRCIVPPRTHHAPVTLEQVREGRIYSNVMSSNFGTNFYCTQAGGALFRYSFTSRPGAVSDAEASLFGRAATVPLEGLFTSQPRERTLPFSDCYARVTPSAVALQALKLAEDGNGWILRLWNPGSAPVLARVELYLGPIERVCGTTLTEEDLDPITDWDDTSLGLEVPPQRPMTVRVVTNGGLH